MGHTAATACCAAWLQTAAYRSAPNNFTSPLHRKLAKANAFCASTVTCILRRYDSDAHSYGLGMRDIIPFLHGLGLGRGPSILAHAINPSFGTLHTANKGCGLPGEIRLSAVDITNRKDVIAVSGSNRCEPRAGSLKSRITTEEVRLRGWREELTIDELIRQDSRAQDCEPAFRQPRSFVLESQVDPIVSTSPSDCRRKQDHTAHFITRPMRQVNGAVRNKHR